MRAIPVLRLARAVAWAALVPGMPASAAAQVVLEAGGGGAFGVPGGSGAGHAGVAWPAGAAVELRGGLGWTAGRVMGAAEVLVPLERGLSVLVPYGAAGAAAVRGGPATDGVVTVGVGLRGRVSGRVDGFVEFRGLLAADDRRVPGSSLILGLRWHATDRRFGRRTASLRSLAPTAHDGPALRAPLPQRAARARPKDRWTL